jgi:non-heme chloroperoxidase
MDHPGLTVGDVTTSDGVTLRYLEAGSGAPLLMIPGWSQTAAQFKHQLEGLSGRYRVIALDMRGHGDSDKPSHGYRISRFAKDLHDVLAALDLDEVNLLSHSLGCAVVWCYLDMFGPARIAKLILADQSPFLTENPSWSKSAREAAEFALTPEQRRDPVTLYEIDNLIDAVTNLVGPNGEAVTRAFVGGLFTKRVSQEEKAWAIDRMLMLPRAYAAGLIYDHALQSWFDVVTRIKLPTLLIGGKASQIPWKSIQWMHEHIPGSRLEIFEEVDGGKHFTFMENPEKFNRIIADFIG